VKLVTFRTGDRTGIGVLDDAGGVVDLAADASLPTNMLDFVAMGERGLEAAAAVVASSSSLPASEVTILAPIRPGNNVMAVGRNYREHAQEFSDSGFDASEVKVIPDHPIIFTKANSSIVGPGDAIDTSNDPLDTTDYEGELGVIIGPGGSKISKENAMDHVYGYTVINDVTARDLQKQHIQFFIGKSPATYCPMGPAITTADEIEDITKAVLRTRVNGELRQESEISLLIFDIPTLIEALSVAIELEPGDVIATGTPVGVGIGLEPPVYLQPGDEVEVSVDGLGSITNPVI
jgi:2-keto-4-pentenoate hydratase/2-oxohepta-3-ene-1,7-dioic acid hydratase in catechol pathway